MLCFSDRANASEDDWLNASAGLALGVGIAMLLMRLLGLSMVCCEREIAVTLSC